MSEPMTRLGAEVVGADALEINTKIARQHASETGLTIDYRTTTAEALAAAGERFDVIVHGSRRCEFAGRSARCGRFGVYNRLSVRPTGHRPSAKPPPGVTSCPPG